MSKIYNKFEGFLFNKFEEKGCLSFIIFTLIGWILIERFYLFLEVSFPVLIIFTPLILVVTHFYVSSKSKNEESLIFVGILYFFIWMDPGYYNNLMNNPPENNPLIHFLSLLPSWLPFWKDVSFNYRPGDYFGDYDFNYRSLDWVYKNFYLSVLIFHIMIIYVILYIRSWTIDLLRKN